MGEWIRSTREVTVAGLARDMAAAIRRHVEFYDLGPILDEAVLCVETESQKPKRGLFARAELVRQSMVLTPRWLVWAVDGTKSAPAVTSAQLVDVVVADYAQTRFAEVVPDTGLQVSGRFTDARENGSAFLGLDDGPAGTRFTQAVLRAAQSAKR